MTSTPHFWKHKRVFVTGCTGLLGSWLTQRLLELGSDVVGLIRDEVPRSSLLLEGTTRRIHVVRGCVEDISVIERALNEYEVDAVFHLAAQTIVGIANRGPLSTFESNIKGTWTVLEACRRSPWVKRIVVASSDKAYGTAPKLPYDENTPLRGRHPYDVSKSCADLLCQSYHGTYGLPVSVTRCGNFFGGGDLNLNRIVPGTIVSVLRRERPLIRSNGDLIRDYLYVEDGVEAYLLLAEKMDDSRFVGEAFNFSYEQPQRVSALVNRILKAMRSTLKPQILNEAQNEIPEQALSAAKARQLLRWRPRYNFDEGMTRTIRWYRQHFKD